ncbi:MAG TPA: alpha/beta hydrolase, partial [Terrimicrobiaceae bacterium]|nr:alpha/beta hydrolase [Terrimicrobiaceae bacterium]
MKTSIPQVVLCLSAALASASFAQDGPAEPKPPATPAETTPVSFPDAETFIYREGQPDPMRLFVVKPAGWKAGDKLPALIWFFGGGWTKGTPEKSIFYARNAAKWGMVGIAPDYRTKNRFDTSPLQSVADGRAALRWVQDHAEELGVDPARIVVGGGSAGGHVALWTAIEKTPPGSDPNEAPKIKPIGLMLMCPVSDTSVLKGYTPKRFGDNAEALSPFHQLDAKMPPVLLLHGDADTTVPFTQSVDLAKKLTDTGNTVE